MTPEPPQKSPPADSNGHPIAVGDTVRQRNVFDRAGGALLVNALQLGVVTDIPLRAVTRVKVDFRRDAIYAFRSTNEAAPPISIRAEYVEVIRESEA